VIPLITDFSPNAVMFRRGESAITQAQFLGQARVLAQRLPEGAHAINLCEDRYHFAFAFCAALLRGHTNLLPNNNTPGAIADLLRAFPGCYVLSDRPSPVPDAPFRAVLADPGAPPMPDAHIEIPPEQLAAIAFTSGTTGVPKPHFKSFGTLVAAAEMSRGMLLPHVGDAQIVATVPPQHMYGLEFTVFWPMVCTFAAHTGKPFFPADLRDTLAAIPRPRVLVTTPVHLRACFDAGLKFPELQQIICATAPLPREWAKRAETVFGAAVTEIYGCTEGGSLASRRTAETEVWSMHQGLVLFGEHIIAPHYPEPIELQDQLEAVTGASFRLIGRRGDLIKVGGKRASLAELTQKLMAIPGVADAVVFMPEGAERPAALVVALELNERHILSQLANDVEALFLPRPLRCVPKLPRDANGKVAQEMLMEMLRA
jgi:acyl-coenzyme A synthetase/AMP-(fatty) acid ligase